MNSVKNLLVVVMLMGVSYGAFQVINTPDPTLTADAPDVIELDIENGPRQFGDAVPAIAAPLVSPPLAPGVAKNKPPVNRLSPGNPATPSIPSLPPGIQNPEENVEPAITETINAAPELVPVTPTPSTNAFPPTAPPASGNLFPPKATAPVQPDADNKSVADSSTFAPTNAKPIPFQPQTNLQPVTPKPVADISQQSLKQIVGAVNQQVTSPATGQINWTGIAQMATSGNVSQALIELSQRYNEPLPADQRMQMLSWLDQLAGKVIYSTEHHLQARPYIVAEGDTLESIAAKWNIPPQLVYNINRSKFGESTTPIPGTELKVVQGPFNAQISLDRMEMTLFLDGMYAGRFPVELGKDHEYEYRSFMIETKSPNGKEYQGTSGQVIAAGAPDNPYGKYWLGFSDSNLCIHESPGMGSNGDLSGCIRVAGRDAEDIYGILSEGSQVSIMR